MSFINDTGSCQSIDLSNPFWAVRWLYSDTDKLIESIVIPVLSIFGFTGNFAFLWTIYRMPKMRTGLNAYLANLAICDILFLVFYVAWPLANLSADPDPVNRAYPVNSMVGCVSWVITTRLWYFASVELTTLISVERYFAICHPVKHRLMTGKTRNVKLLCAVWITSCGITLTIIPRFAAFTRYCLIWPNTPEYMDMPESFNACRSVEGFSNLGAYEGLLYIVFFVLAMALNGVLYFKIILALTRRPIRRHNNQNDNNQQQRPSEADVARNQVARTLIASGIVFFVCQLPYRFYSLDDVIDDLLDIDILDTQPKVTILITGRLFLTLNSIINPYIYVFSCQHYRQAMKEAFRIRTRAIVPMIQT